MPPSPDASTTPRKSSRGRWLILLLLVALIGVGAWYAIQQQLIRIYNPFDPVQRATVAIESLGGVVKVKPGEGRTLYYVTLHGGYHGGDGGIAHLAELPDLDGVYVENGTITDAGAATLGQLTQLDELSLACPRITDAGVQSLKGLRKVRWLNLTGVPMTDQGLATVTGLESLESLTLTGTKITDQGLVHLAPLKRLHKLWLDFTQVSDEGIADLEKLEGLTHVWLGNSQITPEGAQRLRAAREGLEVMGAAPTRFGER